MLHNIGTIEIPDSAGAHGLDIDHARSRLYVACDDAALVEVDAGSGAVTGRMTRANLHRTTRPAMPYTMKSLSLDMYEHSYHLDFGAKAAGSVDTFMAAVRWSNADRLFKELQA